LFFGLATSSSSRRRRNTSVSPGANTPGPPLNTTIASASRSSPPTITARSSRLSSDTLTSATDQPKRSPGAASPGTPGWDLPNTLLPFRAYPSGAPRITVTAPASFSSPGAPTIMSA
jgi:hypothetical protein